MVAPLRHPLRTCWIVCLCLDWDWTAVWDPLDRTDDWELYGCDCKFVSPSLASPREQADVD